jgi:hypothetical protein
MILKVNKQHKKIDYVSSSYLPSFTPGLINGCCLIEITILIPLLQNVFNNGHVMGPTEDVMQIIHVTK